MHTLVDEFASARNRWIGTPFVLVTRAATMPVATPNEHQRTNGAGINEFAGLLQSRVIAMVVSNPDATATVPG